MASSAGPYLCGNQTPVFINIHTHQRRDDDNLSILNLYEHFEHGTAPGYYSMGLHPWHIGTDTLDQQLSALKAYSVNPQVVAIGECGLDRICDTDFRLQTRAFRLQIEWARTLGRPLVVHCVRAFRETREILNESGFPLPVVFHGFRGKAEVAQDLLKKGYYLSLGAAVFEPALQPLIASLPPEKLFLETDESDKPIEQIYRKVASLKNLTTDTLCQHIRQNTQNVFTIPLT